MNLPTIKASLKIPKGFPYFPRVINARRRLAFKFSLKSLFFIFCFALFASNIPSIFSPSVEKQAKIEVLKNSSDIESYKRVISDLMKKREYQLASYIDSLALNLNPLNLDLLKQSDLIYLKINERKIISLQLEKWKKIVELYPDYRDAYARLAYLNLKIGENDEAKKYLEIVKKINPNWPLLTKFNL